MIAPDELYYKMLRIRLTEEEIASRYKEQEMRCPVHLSIGQEACAVGIAALLGKDDFMVSTHRGHAHYLAGGGSVVGLIGELYGKEIGCSRGMGGSMHLCDLDNNFFGSTSIVGGTIPVGVGLAFSKMIKNEPGAVVVCIGDAAIEQGVFHESANFAALHHLPVIFVCENNLYSCYTHIKNRQPQRPLFHVARGHALKYGQADGNDVLDIIDRLRWRFDSVRQGRGPLFVELHTYRTLEHCGPNNDDILDYRTKDELAHWKSKDPLPILKASMELRNQWTKEFEAELLCIREEIDLAFETAKAAAPARLVGEYYEN